MMMKNKKKSKNMNLNKKLCLRIIKSTKQCIYEQNENKSFIYLFSNNKLIGCVKSDEK